MVIGMFTFRWGGLDGVSLEAAKIADVLRAAGHDVAWFGGWLDPAFSPGTVANSADFSTIENEELQLRLFGSAEADPVAHSRLEERAAELRLAAEGFVEEHAIDILMPHNVLSLPLNVPLALALTEVLETREVSAVAHHHDWWFERSSYQPNNVGDFIERCFPYRAMDHLVINTIAAAEVKSRFGVDATYLPNVMDFENEPPPADGPAFREAAGLDAQDIVLLQPTRVIPRKGIQATIALAAALGDDAVKVVVTHAADKDPVYWERLERQATDAGVDLRFMPTRPGYGLANAYAAADLVCYPSLIEGFGNALLEAFFYRRPLFVNRYDVYAADIAATGVRCIETSAGEVTPAVVEDAARVLADPGLYAEAVATNYQVGIDHFSYRVVRERLLPLLER